MAGITLSSVLMWKANDIRYNQLLAHVRARNPLLWILPWFLLGQYAAFLWKVSAWPLAGYPGLLVFFRLPRNCLWCFFTGLLSAYFCLPAPPGLLSRADLRGTLISAPAFPQTGEVVFGLKSSRGVKLQCRAVDLPWRNSGHLGAGDEVAIEGDLYPLSVQANPFTYDARLLFRGYSGRCRVRTLAILHKGRIPFFIRLRQKVAHLVREVVGEGDRAGLLLSLGLGIREALSPDTEKIFKRTGLAHLLVVSGYQISLLYQSVFSLLFFCGAFLRRPCSFPYFRAVTAMLSLICALFFVMLTGAEASGVRAVLGALLFVVSLQLERGVSALNSMIASLILLCLIWPCSFLDPGVQLTYAALSGICLGAESEASTLRTYLSSCFYATLCSSLVALFWFSQVTPWGFVLNFVIPPLASILSCNLAFLTIILYAVGVDTAGRGIILCCDLLSALRDLLRVPAAWEYALLETGTPDRICWAIMFVFVLILAVRKRLQRYAARYGLCLMRNAEAA